MGGAGGAAKAGRGATGWSQAALPRRLGRLRGQPRCLRQGMERHARPVSGVAVQSARPLISAQKMAGYGVAALAAILVLYPVFFLLQAALDVGDPQVRPPTAYGFDNFNGIFQYPQVLLKTLTVSVCATIMALVFGFVMAWILTRTNVPGRHLFEQLMAGPFYLTPFLGP